MTKGFIAGSVSLAVLSSLACSSTGSSSSALATEDSGAPSYDDAGPGTGPADAGPPLQVSYSNPVYDQDFPDPFVLREGKTYYAFSTNSGMTNIQALKSTDLKSWSTLPDALPQLPGWAGKNMGLTWAPSVLKRGDKYVLYYAARNLSAGYQCITRGVASTPEGPYEDASGFPMVCQVDPSDSENHCGSIDPSPFVDVDGKAYLIWKSDENASGCSGTPRIWVQPLSDDGLSVTGTPQVLIRRDQMWEGANLEGPSMVVHDGVYYLFYSANWYDGPKYAIGYAKCSSVTGPCVKVTVDQDTGPSSWVQSKGTASGPGGQEFFTDTDGRLWMAYHAFRDPQVTYGSGGARSLRIDPVTFNGSTPSTIAPSTSSQTY